MQQFKPGTTALSSLLRLPSTGYRHGPQQHSANQAPGTPEMVIPSKCIQQRHFKCRLEQVTTRPCCWLHLCTQRP